MKKIAFMFVAAAMFVACGEKKAAETAEVAEPVAVDTLYTLVDDSTVIVTIGEQADTLVNDSAAIELAKAAAAPAEEAAPAAEAPAAE
jgi:hypothetical protein